MNEKQLIEYLKEKRKRGLPLTEAEKNQIAYSPYGTGQTCAKHSHPIVNSRN